ncbi:hypothetical protein TNCV_1619721 [Trichonephila clavipes]|nr:hypothetical protein TNCV_1619721 [Trichonephila clavipes]
MCVLCTRRFGRSIVASTRCLDMLGGATEEEKFTTDSKLSGPERVDSGNVDETEVSSGILPEKAQEH